MPFNDPSYISKNRDKQKDATELGLFLAAKIQILSSLEKALDDQQRFSNSDSFSLTEKEKEILNLARQTQNLKQALFMLQEVMQSKTLFGWHYNRLSETDITVLITSLTQAASVIDYIDIEERRINLEGPKLPRPELKQDEKGESKTLSQRIESTKEIEYAVSDLKRWLRRLAVFLIAISLSLIGIILIGLMMYSGPMTGSDIIESVVTNLLSTLSIFGLGRGSITSTFDMTVGPSTLPVTIVSPAPQMTFAEIARWLVPWIAGARVAKFIMHPKREVAAQATQAATTSGLIIKLEQKVKEQAFADEKIRSTLQAVIKEAGQMYQAGMNTSWAHNRVTRFEKARLMLAATASFLESGNASKCQSVTDLLKFEYKKVEYQKIINARRRPSIFSSPVSVTADALQKTQEGIQAEAFDKQMSLKEISAAMAA